MFNFEFETTQIFRFRKAYRTGSARATALSMACTLASVFSLCAQPGGSRDGALLGALRDRLDRDRRHSDTVMS